MSMSRTSIAVRRPTVSANTLSSSSKSLSASKDKSLSNVTLTKRTNSLSFDVEELKANLKNLQVQGLEVAQQDQTLQTMEAKVNALQNAFTSLSDVCLSIEDVQKRMTTRLADVLSRITSLEQTVQDFDTYRTRVETQQKQSNENSERRFSDVQQAFAKLMLSQYETQADLERTKQSTEQLLSRERDATQALQTLQSTQEQTQQQLRQYQQEWSDWTTSIESYQQQNEKRTLAIAQDIQSLSHVSTQLRQITTQQQTQWNHKFQTLKETIDRQCSVDKQQLSQRLDGVSEHLILFERRNKDSFNSLLKNQGRLREAVDESIAICASEIKTWTHEYKRNEREQRLQIDELMTQVTTLALNNEQIQRTVRAMDT